MDSLSARFHGRCSWRTQRMVTDRPGTGWQTSSILCTAYWFLLRGLCLIWYHSGSASHQSQLAGCWCGKRDADIDMITVASQNQRDDACAVTSWYHVHIGLCRVHRRNIRASTTSLFFVDTDYISVIENLPFWTLHYFLVFFLILSHLIFLVLHPYGSSFSGFNSPFSSFLQIIQFSWKTWAKC